MKAAIGDILEVFSIAGGEVKKGYLIWWKNEECLKLFSSPVTTIETLKKFTRIHGDGPFKLVEIHQYGSEVLFLFCDKQSREVEINADYFCADNQINQELLV